MGLEPTKSKIPDLQSGAFAALPTHHVCFLYAVVKQPCVFDVSTLTHCFSLVKCSYSPVGATMFSHEIHRTEKFATRMKTLSSLFFLVKSCFVLSLVVLFVLVRTLPDAHNLCQPLSACCVQPTGNNSQPLCMFLTLAVGIFLVNCLCPWRESNPRHFFRREVSFRWTTKACVLTS